jgi:copper resistance protein B
VVVGLRQDARPGPAQSWLALGVQGLAPYWFEIEATAYIGTGGRTAARLVAEYELLLTNRLVLQPVVEFNLFGKTDVERGFGAGLSTVDGELRLRYEIRREFAPYIGIRWRDTFGDTSRLAAAAGESAGSRRLVAGLRLWF